MTSQNEPGGSATTNDMSTASDRCDCGWCEIEPGARAIFWRCYVGGLVLLIAVIFLFS